MVAKRVFIGFFICLLGTTALATTRSPRLGGPEFCNIQRLTNTQPNQRYQFEGGMIEAWEVNDDFQCVGVVPVKYTIQPNSLTVPRYAPYPHLVFIEEGEGIIGVNFPGCAETFDTGVEQQQESTRRMTGRKQQGGYESSDSHQKVIRFKQGDIIAIPAGAVHWEYNDGNQQVVAIIIGDINNPSNQLDLQDRTFLLAGGIASQLIQGQQKQQGQKGVFGKQQRWSISNENIFAGFETELLAEAFNSETEIIRKMQESRNLGLIVEAKEPMTFVTPDEQQQYPRQVRGQQGERSPNGLEETVCSTKILFNLDNQREADVFSRQAGKLSIVNENKLPILSFLDLSAEKGHLQQNALVTPHWSINSHTIVYVLSGEAQVQTISNNGEAVFDEQVRKGDIFVVPQFFATTAKAGQNGFEWVAFKTNKSPMKSPVAGYTSVFRALPLQVITNAYQISPSQAQNLKINRETESILLSPQRTSQIY